MQAAELRCLIEDSGFFDPQYYLARNSDVAASSHDPFDHYLWWGGDENRAPSEKFDPEYYAAQCALEGINPGNCLMHYLTVGRAAGLYPTPLEHALHRTGLPAIGLAQKFESWGRDCEFGIVQRKLGAEPLDLFRFSDPTPEVLVDLIKSDFARYGDNCYVTLEESRPRREWRIIDPETATSRHTHIFEGDMAQAMIQKLAVFWARLLREKTAAEIATGEKIYVMKTSNDDLDEEAMIEVAKALRSKGPAWLMWVQPGTPVGHCEIVVDGLLRARIDRLCLRTRETEFSLVGWLKVMCEARNTLANDALHHAAFAKK
jgi:hypothetical protein